jgi:hypothetical protein
MMLASEFRNREMPPAEHQPLIAENASGTSWTLVLTSVQ